MGLYGYEVMDLELFTAKGHYTKATNYGCKPDLPCTGSRPGDRCPLNTISVLRPLIFNLHN